MAKKSESRATAEAEAESHEVMSPEGFRAWRKRLGLKQKEAAEQLGLKKRMIQYYERGHRDGHDVLIPKTVRLACHSLANGVADFDGENPVALVPPAAPEPAPETEAVSPAASANGETPNA